MLSYFYDIWSASRRLLRHKSHAHKDTTTLQPLSTHCGSALRLSTWGNSAYLCLVTRETDSGQGTFCHNHVVSGVCWLWQNSYSQESSQSYCLPTNWH